MNNFGSKPIFLFCIFVISFGQTYGISRILNFFQIVFLLEVCIYHQQINSFFNTTENPADPVKLVNLDKLLIFEYSVK